MKKQSASAVRANFHPATMLLLAMLVCCPAWSPCLLAQETPKPDAPVVAKVEPPNWWVGLTSEVMLLVSGKHLEATHAECNLPTVKVLRTESSGAGDYLFVWLKIGAETRSGTVVCRLTTAAGTTSFELPLAARKPTVGRFQGLAANDVMYLIKSDHFANGDPSNDAPADGAEAAQRGKTQASHGGDLRGITGHLAYLKDLGVTTLRLTPIVKSATGSESGGRWATDLYGDLYGVDAHFGSLHDYQELVTEAHKMRLKVFLDFSANAVGPEHPWAHYTPLPDWLRGTKELQSRTPARGSLYGTPYEEPNHSLEVLTDPHATERLKRDAIAHVISGSVRELNTKNPLAAQYALQNAIWWIETAGLDGFCVNPASYGGLGFSGEWYLSVRKLYPNFSVVSEIDHPDASVVSRFAGGTRRTDGADTGLTTLFDSPMYYALRDVLLRDAPAGRIADVLRHDSLYSRLNFLLPYFGNEKAARFASEKGYTPVKLRLAFGLILTLRGIPELYFGDEIALAGEDGRADFPDGRGDSRNAFTAEGRTAGQQAVFTYVRELLRLRREHAALQSGALWHLSSSASSYVFLRENEDERTVVAFNGAKEPVELKISLSGTPAERISGATIVFGVAQASVGRDELRLSLPGESLTVFSVN